MIDYEFQGDKLYINGQENIPSSDNILEHGIKKIIFGINFNEPLLEGTLDLIKHVEEISFGDNFNQSIDNLPIGVKKINFSTKFDNSIDNLPSSIEIIRFEVFSIFNQPVDNLPIGLKKIIFNNTFDQPIDFLPSTLEEIKFIVNSKFSHSFDNLPNSIKILEIPIRYTNEINNLPNSIEELRIGVKSYAPNKYSWEDPIYAFGFDYNFEVEMFNTRISKFPSNLKKLYIYNKYEHIEELKEILGDKLVVV